MARVISFSSRKGGTGKTTLSFNIASLVAEEREVLLIDMDSQAQSTLHYGIQPQNVTYGIYEALVDFVEGSRLKGELFIKSKGFTLIPSNQKLAVFDIEFSDIKGKEGILKDFIIDIEDNFDYIFIDTPPNLGLTTINALSASDYLIIPVKVDFLSLAGLAQIMEVFYRVNATLNPVLKLLGIVPMMFDKRTKMSQEVLQQLKDTFGENLVFPPVRTDIKVMEAASYGIPVHIYAPRCRAARDLKAIGKSIIERVEGEKGIRERA